MKTKRSGYFPLLLLLSACGGGPTIRVNGIEVYEKYWNQTLEDLRPRAAFDLNCPTGQSEFVLFKRVGALPSEVGVVGCSKRATYVRTIVQGIEGPWLLNVTSADQPPATVAPQPAKEPPPPGWSYQPATP